MNRREELAASLAAVEQRIDDACTQAGRAREEVQLIVVTKTFPAQDARLLADLGVTQVGESRDQEASAKVAELQGLPLTWHCIGQVQTNKARSVVRWADVVHSVASQRLVTALAKEVRKTPGRPPLGCLVQVNLDPQAPEGRGGVQPRQVLGLADVIADTEGLELRGVMAVAPREADPRAAFEQLAQVAASVHREHPGATWVSAGMSGDLEAAVAFGSTHLRVGGAVLGNRPTLK